MPARAPGRLNPKSRRPAGRVDPPELGNQTFGAASIRAPARRARAAQTRRDGRFRAFVLYLCSINCLMLPVFACNFRNFRNFQILRRMRRARVPRRPRGEFRGIVRARGRAGSRFDASTTPDEAQRARGERAKSRPINSQRARGQRASSLDDRATAGRPVEHFRSVQGSLLRALEPSTGGRNLSARVVGDI